MADTNFGNVGFLLNFEDDTGLGVPLFLDRSKYRMRLSAFGDGVISDTAKKFGNYGLLYAPGGLGSGVLFPINTGDTHLDFGTGDFTIEGWFYINPAYSNNIQPIIGRELGWNKVSDWIVFRENDATSGKLKFVMNNFGITIASDVDVSTGAFHSFAIVRISGVISMFLDGVKQAATNTAGIATTTLANNIRVGYATIGYYLRGYLDDLRITVGVGRYTANYTPAVCEYPADPVVSSYTNAITPTVLFPTSDIAAYNISGMTVSWHYYYGGYGRIAATIKEKSTPANIPLARPVHLFSKETMAPVAATWSNSAGEYSFERVSPNQKFFVVGFDYLKNYNAVIADEITPTTYQY